VRFIPETETETLRSHLERKLEGPVTLDLFIEPKSAIIVPGRPECELCEETRALLEDVASLSNQITVTVHDVRKQSDLARKNGCEPRADVGVARSCARSGAVLRYSTRPGVRHPAEDLAAVSRGHNYVGK